MKLMIACLLMVGCVARVDSSEFKVDLDLEPVEAGIDSDEAFDAGADVDVPLNGSPCNGQNGCCPGQCGSMWQPGGTNHFSSQPGHVQM